MKSSLGQAELFRSRANNTRDTRVETEIPVPPWWTWFDSFRGKLHRLIQCQRGAPDHPRIVA